MNVENITYFDSFGVTHTLKEIRKSLEIKMLKQIFIEYKHMSGYFCIGFINFMLRSKSLFSPNEYKKIDKTILKYFQ